MMSGGVVERASKEISRRISSLGFKSGSSKRTKSVDDPNRDTHDEKAKLDKLNGNVEGVEEASAAAPMSSKGTSMGSKVGTFVRGSVMDKVTHVFTVANSPKDQSSSNGSGNSINIPKGAVANGRARFESEAKNNSDEKAGSSSSRFFSSNNTNNKSKFGSPMLPVKNRGSRVDTKKMNATAVKATTATTTMATTTTTTTSMSSTRLVIKKEYVGWSSLWQDESFVSGFASHLPPSDWPSCSQVCWTWRQALYSLPKWSEHFRPVLKFKELRIPQQEKEESNDTCGRESELFALKLELMRSFVQRRMDDWVLWQANDVDIFDFVQKFSFVAGHVRSVELRNCNIADRSLEAIAEFLNRVTELSIVGCNELTEQGLWSSLNARITHLTIHDCINVADECICAVTQLLPNLQAFNLQAYHVTDSALAYFSPKQSPTLVSLSLHSCWEITNHGVVNIVHTLPNLTELSLSGCSKLTDDGVELIAENLRKLRRLDVSWCPRITDHALEYIACDLHKLEELNLDRCVHVSDIGIGYISTLMALNTLYLRWCSQLKDYGLQHICNMHNLRILSLAGCPLLTSGELTHLVQLRHLRELELTNCPGATNELVEYLRQGLPGAIVID